MDISDDEKNRIKRREGGFAPSPYDDGVGNWTVGYGHKVTPWDRAHGMFVHPITERHASDLFNRDISNVANGISRQIHVPLSQRQFDAIVSLAYNAGAGPTGHRPHPTEYRSVRRRLARDLGPFFGTRRRPRQGKQSRRWNSRGRDHARPGSTGRRSPPWGCALYWGPSTRRIDQPNRRCVRNWGWQRTRTRRRGAREPRRDYGRVWICRRRRTGAGGGRRPHHPRRDWRGVRCGRRTSDHAGRRIHTRCLVERGLASKTVRRLIPEVKGRARLRPRIQETGPTPLMIVRLTREVAARLGTKAAVDPIVATFPTAGTAAVDRGAATQLLPTSAGGTPTQVVLLTRPDLPISSLGGTTRAGSLHPAPTGVMPVTRSELPVSSREETTRVGRHHPVAIGVHHRYTRELRIAPPGGRMSTLRGRTTDRRMRTLSGALSTVQAPTSARSSHTHTCADKPPSQSAQSIPPALKRRRSEGHCPRHCRPS
jgi:GH24 family phage-related lysozyme (muramidase)